MEKLKCWRDDGGKWKVSTIHPDGNVHVWTNYQHKPYNSFSFISVKTQIEKKIRIIKNDAILKKQMVSTCCLS